MYRRRFCIFFALTVTNFLSCGCESPPPSDEGKGPPTTTAEVRKSENESIPDVVHIPIGEFIIGSDPGQSGRDPALEPLSTQLRLGPFRIDTQLVRNEDGSVKFGLSRPEAETICAKKGGRLCSEAEWERACRGPSSALYPLGDAACTTDERCRSGFDTLEMTQRLEWTASQFGKGSVAQGKPVIRGSLPSSRAKEQRRCAARRSPSEQKGEAHAIFPKDIAFRCCYGAPNAATIKEPSLQAPYEETQVSTEELRKLLKSDPITAPYSEGAKFFKTDAAATVLARGPGDTKGFRLTTAPLLWHPGPGSEYLVMAGHDDNRNSFIVAYYTSGGQKKLAGSFIMHNEPGPVALAYADSIRPRVHFSGCWGCPGETGKVLFREPEELVFLQP